ncbi:MAG TPA: GtrA family protein, partial [Acidimicrobiales bacterium]|nr:GtrA family protein [Acidimicrobiales bacterium]
MIGLSVPTRVAGLRHSPLVGRITRYTAGSVVALAVSEVAFAACYWGGTGTTVASVIAFFAGAVPNWILNRRWAW